MAHLAFGDLFMLTFLLHVRAGLLADKKKKEAYCVKYGINGIFFFQSSSSRLPQNTRLNPKSIRSNAATSRPDTKRRFSGKGNAKLLSRERKPRARVRKPMTLQHQRYPVHTRARDDKRVEVVDSSRNRCPTSPLRPPPTLAETSASRQRRYTPGIIFQFPAGTRHESLSKRTPSSYPCGPTGNCYYYYYYY